MPDEGTKMSKNLGVERNIDFLEKHEETSVTEVESLKWKVSSYVGCRVGCQTTLKLNQGIYP